MSQLNIYPEQWAITDGDERQIRCFSDSREIRQRLAAIGVLFDNWETTVELPATAGEEAILDAYAVQVTDLKRQHGFTTADVVSLSPDHPDRTTLRQKFLSEHTHSDFEVRFFVAGQGLFYIHAEDAVYGILCQRGDLISVPDGIRHWFDMGASPSFTCIRLFRDPAGWVADYTGDPIAERFPLLEQFNPVTA